MLYNFKNGEEEDERSIISPKSSQELQIRKPKVGKHTHGKLLSKNVD